MSYLFARVLPVASTILAALLLAVLLTVSTAPAGEAFRAIDNKTGYLVDLAIALDQELGRSRVTTSDATIIELAATLPTTTAAIANDIARIYQSDGLLAAPRRYAILAFNLADEAGFDPRSATHHEAKLARLEASALRVEQHIPRFLENRARYGVGNQRLSDGTRELVQQLRSTGRDGLADQVFRAGNQIMAYVSSGEPIRLEQTAAVLDRLRNTVSSLSAAERSTSSELLDVVPTLIDTRRAMNEALRSMDLAGMAATTEAFRDSATIDQVRALSMINEARVLTNLYTVFLLGVLAYLGLRLRSSYSELNRSHEDLEVRVNERTSDLKLAYEDLKESQVQLVQAEKMSSLGQLVAGVMHEINTPLLYVLNNTSVTSEVVSDMDRYIKATLPLVEANSAEDAKAALNQLARCRKSFDAAAIREGVEEVVSLNQDSVEGLNQISELVQSLKDFSRLDRATEDRFDVCEGLEKTLTITKNLLKYGIEVEKSFEAVDEIFCSPARINQIFVNLVTNAAQAMDGEGKLTIEVGQSEDFVEISFEDTGCGIPEEDMSKIMDPFYTTKPVGQGTGLGLSIVHQIINQHNGQIDIQSTVGEGTRITIRLPKQPYKEEAA